ncbi:fimbrial biogenesis outer membrane usher protein [Lysobacter sp. HDW10]|nr:fimbrial biogenesis outer membrane usher protein [Lysobacter sp. HDW10]
MTQPRSRHRLRPDLLAFAVACCLSVSAFAGDGVSALSPSTDISEAADELYLQVTVNEQLRPSVYRFVLRDGHLFASPATLLELGLQVQATESNERLLPVERDGIRVFYDSAAQTVALSAPVSALSADTTRLNAPPISPPVSDAPWGGLLNYDLDAFRGNGVSNIVVAPALRLFGPGNFTFETNGVLQTTDVGGKWNSRAIRLDTRLRWTSADKALEVILGDLVTNSPEWARQTRMAGIRFGTNYPSLQPYRVLSPGPIFSGESAVPTSVELYVNGIKQFEGESPPGRFVVSGLPSMEGLGNARLVLTDAYGRAREVDIPFYGTRRLLARGLNDWSVSVGRVRLGYGADSNRYDAPVALDASWRRGISERFTGEVHAEVRRDLQLGGAGGAFLIGKAGVVHAAWSDSRSRGLKGSQTRWGYQWSNGVLSAAFDSQRTHGDYRDLAAVSSGFLPAQRSESANVGLNSALLGSFNLTYANLQYPKQARNRIAGAYWSRAIGRGWFAHAGIQRDLDNSAQNSFQFGISATLGDDYQSSASMRHTNATDMYEANVMKQARANGDIGWRIQARQDTPSGYSGLAEATWLTRAAELTAGVAHGTDGSGNQYRMAARGSVLWMGRSLFASREVVSGFALVDTGIAGVPVSLENRPYGVTNASGQLIVTPVFPFQNNRISIDPTALPANIRVPRKDLDAVPGASGAAKVTFDLQPVHAAVVVLVDTSGTVVPMGSSVRRIGTDSVQEDTIVGYDGEVYLEGLAKTNTLEVTIQSAKCIAEFTYDEKATGIPRIEPVQCVVETK